jgi:hypothetical protein
VVGVLATVSEKDAYVTPERDMTVPLAAMMAAPTRTARTPLYFTFPPDRHC